MAPKKAMKKDTHLLSQQPLRGQSARCNFLTDVATTSTLPLQDVKKVLDGLRITVARNLREHKRCVIPNMMSLRLKIYPARAEYKQIVFGKEKTVKARHAEMKKIMVSTLNPLKESVE